MPCRTDPLRWHHFSVSARTASIRGEGLVDLGAAAAQLDTARRVLRAALDQVRSL